MGNATRKAALRQRRGTEARIRQKAEAGKRLLAGVSEGRSLGPHREPAGLTVREPAGSPRFSL